MAFGSNDFILEVKKMKLIIDNQIREKYPDLRIGVVIAQNLNNELYKDELADFCRNTFTKFADKFESFKELDEVKNIIAWREIYRSFGVNPKKKKPTAESLLARSIKSGFVPHISPAVDAYLCAETIHFLPIGGYDLTRIADDIILRYAKLGEDFVGVGSEEEENTIEGEVVYADSTRILTRCWNYKDCDFAKIDTHTKTIALFVEGAVSEITDEEIKETTDAIANNLKTYCEASCTVKFLMAEQSEIEIM